MKTLALLGSTGSIGVNALKFIRQNPESYRVLTLAAGRNIDLLAAQIREFRPRVVAVLNETLAAALKARLPDDTLPHVHFGTEGFTDVATCEGVDTVISAVAGAAGLLPNFMAVCAGKELALANKETMVMAGSLMMAEAGRRGTRILPIDSEHSAILQSMQGHPREDVRRIILTASGGPFRDFSVAEMERVSPAQALKHPNWTMGPKVSVDSATMMNKGLEAIEAKWFFGLEMDQIGILVHPQSIVHSMVEYKDGSTLAQLAPPDMIIPIAYALSFPSHMETGLHPLDLSSVGVLSFFQPDMARFRCLGLALEAGKKGGSMPAVLNGANEVAVESFLAKKIGFLDIPRLIEKTMEAHRPHPIDGIDAVLAADQWARQTATAMLHQM
jgi:1-deoxy-D-xylulose-5-phosphate reductoisomerase